MPQPAAADRGTILRDFPSCLPYFEQIVERVQLERDGQLHDLPQGVVAAPVPELGRAIPADVQDLGQVADTA